MLRAIVGWALLLWATAPARAACTAADEPGLGVLSARALRVAALEPGRIRSMLRRARAAALLPHVQARVGRGTNDYARNVDSLDPTFTTTDTWRFDVTVSFALDRLAYDPHELHVAEAAGRVAEHRAHLLERVAALWRGRRALDAAPPEAEAGSAVERAEAADRCLELTVLLDALTGGALGAGRGNSLPPAGPRR